LRIKDIEIFKHFVILLNPKEKRKLLRRLKVHGTINPNKHTRDNKKEEKQDKKEQTVSKMFLLGLTNNLPLKLIHIRIFFITTFINRFLHTSTVRKYTNQFKYVLNLVRLLLPRNSVKYHNHYRVDSNMIKKSKNIVFGLIISAIFGFIVSTTVQNTLSPSPVKAEGGFSFTMAGDFGYNNLATATLDKIKELNPAFHIANGDFSYDEITPESAWCSYVKSKVGSTFPFELVTGNHEAGDPPGGNIDNFTPCLPHRLTPLTGVYGKEYYFDYQGARFIQISPGFEGPLLYDYTKGTEHYNWTKNAIDSAKTAGIKWVIVSMHENCITMGDKTCDIGPDIMNLMLEKKVDLVLQGHDHTYQRSKQLSLNQNCPLIIPGTYNANCVANSSNNYKKDAGTIFAIVGTGGAELYSVNTADSEAGYFSKWMGGNNQPRHGLLQVNIVDDQLTGQFIGSTSTESSFADSFSITAITPSPTNTGSSQPTASPITSFAPIRLTEGTTYTDSSNHQWIHDTIADGGEIYTTNQTISNTTTQNLYQSERFGKDINYGFNVPNGTYQIKIKLAEIYFTQAGERIFNLNLNGNNVLVNYDILSENTPFTAIDKTFNITVTDQKINLDFSTVKDNAKLSAIEILQTSQATPEPTVQPTIQPTASASPIPTATPQASFTPIRLNTGVTTTDTINNTWSSDATSSSGGSTYTVTNTIANTANQKLFQSERYGKDFSYSKSVPNGSYIINLNFAEIYYTHVGERIFNVDVNGTRILGNFDILTQTTPFTALTKSYQLTVTNAQIKIDFSTVLDNAKISSFEILQTTSPSPTMSPTPSPTTEPTAQPIFSPIRLNTGMTTTDSQNNTWTTDTNQATGGQTFTTTNTITNTSSQKLFQSERYGNTLNYSLNVPNGSYKVNLNFSEIYFTQANERIFNVAINGSPVLSNFDILAQVAPNTALTKSFPINVTNGKIQISFTTVKDNAKLASLEIIQAASPTNTPEPTVQPTIQPTPSPTPTPTTIPSTTPIPSGNLSGLNATYYDNKDFTGTAVTRIDPQVYFDWLHGAPMASMGVDTYSVRWIGFIVPKYSENYTFYTDSDDGVRVWINNVLIIDKWVDQGETEHSGSIVLQANQKYAIKVEYYDNAGSASCKLRWESASQIKGTVPASAFFTQ
jgi:hypothetical protein